MADLHKVIIHQEIQGALGAPYIHKFVFISLSNVYNNHNHTENCDAQLFQQKMSSDLFFKFGRVADILFEKKCCIYNILRDI